MLGRGARVHPAGRLDDEQREDKGAEGGRASGALGLAEGRVLDVLDAKVQLLHRVAAEARPAVHELVRHAAERPQVDGRAVVGLVVTTAR